MKSAWKKHKKVCKAPTSPPATVAELRTLHNGIALLNMCIQRNGAGDGPTSVVLDFLCLGFESGLKNKENQIFYLFKINSIQLRPESPKRRT